ncbi:hypothetical protein KAI12_01960 [Candidatus Bathyarchaeota archaeon]|nr:hypothetical protein [Candidatus Bathyarchaeota archaeon]
MRVGKSIGEDLAVIAEKHGVGEDLLFEAMLNATKNEQAECGDLLVRFRGKADNTLIFLITKNLKVVAQIRVSPNFLYRQENPIRQFMNCRKILKIRAKNDKTGGTKSIQELRSGMKGVELEAKVISVSEPRYVTSKFGTQCCFAKVVLADETGQIELCLWNQDSKLLSLGDTIQIENGRVSRFRGKTQLSLSRGGSINITKDKSNPISFEVPIETFPKVC